MVLVNTGGETLCPLEKLVFAVSGAKATHTAKRGPSGISLNEKFTQKREKRKERKKHQEKS